MTQRLALHTAPAAEPIDLATAKTHLRVSTTAEDDLISALISSARQACEVRLRRALVTQTWDLLLDDFPRIWYRDQLPLDPRRLWAAEAIALPMPTLQSVTSVTYIDQAGTTQVMDPAAYQVVTGTPGTVAPAYGTYWPLARWQPAAVTIRFVAGYGAATAVPACVKQAMLLLVGHWYESREAVAVNVGANIVELPVAVEALLAPEQFGKYS